MAFRPTRLQEYVRRAFVLATSFPVMAVAGVLIAGIAGCVSPELMARAERVEIFESAAPPAGYVTIGQVYASERFLDLRPIERRVIDKLKFKAAKLDADAIGNIHILRSSRVRFAATPRYIELSGSADYYRKRPANWSPPSPR